jgi:mannose-6-phosphate isomerase-like protein (cupin superfamily)
MKRRRMFPAFKAALEAGNYSDLPELPAAVDPQVYLSRNSVPQPFHLVCGKDTVLVQMSGEAVVHLRDSSVNRFNLVPGDHVYVPAGTPHRVIPLTESVQLRYKAPKAGLEGVVWFCEHCGRELAGADWDTSVVVPQRAYLQACAAFNESDDLRTCRGCGAEHPSIDLGLFAAWDEIATALEAERAAESAIAPASSAGS